MWIFIFITATAFKACPDVTRRINCGYPPIVQNISESQCLQRKCCYDKNAGADFRCFHQGDAVPIKKVHVIQSNHFDAGYGNTTVNMLNKYYDRFFPRALADFKGLHNTSNGEGLKWMTQSWIISLYLNCPPNLGLHCPNAENKAMVLDLIKEGVIRWHAFPFNAELALISPDLFKFGVEMTQALSKKTGAPIPTVLSQRDVPGVTRAMIPTFLEAGLNGISIGSNVRVNPPIVPPIFRWRNSGRQPKESNLTHETRLANDEEIVVLWNSYGYGGLTDTMPPIVQIPECEVALAYAWRGDNFGPPMSANEVFNDWKEIMQWFPDAEIIPSTFEDYLDDIRDFVPQLPVISSELSDTWIFGIGSDPEKTMWHRAAQRILSSCISNEECSYEDPLIANFSRFLMKNTEHTWGLSISNLKQYGHTGYDSSEFRNALKAHDPVYKFLADSWVEQRTFGFDLALFALKSHPLRTAILNEFNAMKVSPFVDLQSSPQRDFLLNWVKISVSESGGISRMVDLQSNKTFSDGILDFLQLSYETLNQEEDLIPWDEILVYYQGTWGQYGKPGSNATHQNVPPTLVGVKQTGSTLLITSQFPQELNEDFGAPAFCMILIDASIEGQIRIDISLYNKTATRNPEATFVRFAPRGVSAESLYLNKVDGWISPHECRNGSSKGLHAVNRVLIQSEFSTMIESLDAPLLKIGKQTPLPLPQYKSLDYSNGVSFVLHDNIWNTNYPFWFPFQLSDDELNLQTNLNYRFIVKFE